MEPASQSDLRATVERLHNCIAVYRASVDVREAFEGKAVWEGTVSIFSVDLPQADTCFAWSSPIDASNKRKFYAVLKIHPVESAADAVRASIVADERSKTDN